MLITGIITTTIIAITTPITTTTVIITAVIAGTIFINRLVITAIAAMTTRSGCTITRVGASVTKTTRFFGANHWLC